MQNRFITIEGLDGSGKSTIVTKIVNYLINRHDIDHIVTAHEPGGTPISDTIRSFITHKSLTESINSISELLLLYAARSQLLENVIKPSLLQGYWVISDRYELSSYAYQGGGRNIDQFFIQLLSQKVTNNFSPDLVFYLDISPEIGLSRIMNKRKLDRIEEESLSFFKRVRLCYQKLAALQTNIITIDANQNLKIVSETVFKHLDIWLSKI